MHKNSELKKILQETSNRLKKDETPYSWGHFGKCNCGHLAQTVTKLTSKEIHESASFLGGDWGVRVEEYCPVSRFLIDDIIRKLLTLGLEHEDIIHLENLSDKNVLGKIPGQPTYLDRNSKEHAILYFDALIELIDD